MSETVAQPVHLTPPTPASNSNLGPAIGSMGIGAAAILVLGWALTLVHVVLPPDVSVALVTLASAGAHYLQDRFVGTNS